MPDWTAAIVVLEEYAADSSPMHPPSRDATLAHVRALLGPSEKAREAFAQAERLVRAGRAHEAAAYLDRKSAVEGKSFSECCA